MCQFTKHTEPVITITEPMAVYKIVEMYDDEQSIIKSFYRQMLVKLGETYQKQHSDPFIVRVESARKYEFRFNAWCYNNVFRIEDEGFHSITDIKHATELLNHLRCRTSGKLAPSRVLIECVIPAGSQTIRGVFSDKQDIGTIVSDVITYGEVLEL